MHSDTERFRVDEWTVDPIDRTLSKDGAESVKIEPKLTALLQLLARHPGEVVKSKQIIREVWGEKHYTDPIPNAISRLRKALGDNSDQPTYIQTVPGTGYRLVARVLWLGSSGSESDPLDSAPAPTPEPTNKASVGSSRLRFWGLLAAGVLAAALISQWANRFGSPPPAPLNLLPSIAVLPFDDTTLGQTSTTGAGLARDVLPRLGAVKGLRVIPSAVSFPHLNQNIGVIELAKRINADFILDGTISEQDGQVKVRVELTKAQDGLLVNAAAFERPVTELDQIASDIADQVATWLGLSPPTMGNPAASFQAVSVDAKKFYYSGLEYLRRTNESSNLNAAIGLFEQALALEPRYAAALAGSCEAYLRLYIVEKKQSLFDTAADRCNFAFTLQRTIPEVQVSMGILYREAGKLAESEQHLDKVLAKAPDNVDAMIELAETYADQGRLSSAEALLQKAVAIQPGYWESYSALGSFLYNQGKYQDALSHMLWVTRLMPMSAKAFTNLGNTYDALGDSDEANKAWHRSVALEPSKQALLSLGIDAYYQRDFEAAADYQEQATQLAGEDYWPWAMFAEASRFVPKRVADVASSLQQAVRLVEQRLVVKPTDGFARAQLGLYMARLGNAAAAHEHIAKAHEISPENMDIFQVEAAVWAEENNAIKVCEALRRAEALGFDRKWILADVDFEPFLGPDCL